MTCYSSMALCFADNKASVYDPKVELEKLIRKRLAKARIINREGWRWNNIGQHSVSGSRTYVMTKIPQNRWLRLAIFLVSLTAISYGLAYALQGLFSQFQLAPNRLFLPAYLIVFGTTLLANATIIAPVPVALAIMITAATKWDPLLIAFSASIGGALGELSGYYVGYLGKKIASIQDMAGYKRIAGWMNRYGVWAIFLLALQPVLPFDIAGIIAGTAKMPLRKFLPALWGGKFIKHTLICYFGAWLMCFLPFWPS